MTNGEWLLEMDVKGKLSTWFLEEHIETLDEAIAECDRLRNENNILARNLKNCEVDRERYRAKFGKACDLATCILNMTS